MGFLQNPDPARKLARQYGIRGLFSPEIVPSVQPVTLIDDLTGGITNEPQRIGVGRAAVTGVAAESSVVRLETPPGIIAEIIEIYLFPATSTLINVFMGSFYAAPATFVAGQFTDGRLRLPGQQPALRIGVDTYAVANTAIHYTYTASSGTTTPVAWNPNWVMGSAASFDFIEITAATVNNTLLASIKWREYSADQVR